jgi:PAS domain S-box-containing protein
MFVFEHRVRRYDGEWRLFAIRAVPVLEQDGAIREWVGVHVDITEERNLLNALRLSEQHFRQTIDSMPQLVWSTLPDGVPDLFNKQWIEYTGLPADGQVDAMSAVHRDDLPLTLDRWRHSLETGEPFEVEFRCLRHDGQYRWFLGRATPIRNEQGRIVRWFGTSTDIEDRKKAEMAVVTKQKLESLGLLAGGIAHDFNNLLVGVLGGASYAAQALPDVHPLQSVMTGIVSAAERAAHLTRQMLAYAGKGRFLVESIDVPDLIRTTSNLIKGSIPKHVQLAFEISETVPAIEADSGQMQQIVMNLILNAAESIDPARKGLVTVKAKAAQLDAVQISGFEIVSGALVPGSYLVLEFQDNGCGMDHETQTKIFDPFFTTKFTGRGLGLSAVHGILRTHNGALELRSRVKEGSTFRVFLPASSKPVPGSPLPRERADRGAGTILVVDDEEIVRRIAQTSLERAGFQVLLAESGEQAVDTLLNKQLPGVDLILLDMSMAGMDGRDVIERIRSLGIAVPVLICSGYSEAEVSREFAGLDIAGFIPKPFTSRQLSDRIQAALQKEKAG